MALKLFRLRMARMEMIKIGPIFQLMSSKVTKNVIIMGLALSDKIHWIFFFQEKRSGVWVKAPSDTFSTKSSRQTRNQVSKNQENCIQTQEPAANVCL